MPGSWNEAIVWSIFKKEDQTLFCKYRGIPVLYTTYNVLSKILRNCLHALENKISGEYQGGFRAGEGKLIDFYHLTISTE